MLERVALNAGERVLVTGASGFLGSAVARALLARGMQVRVLVRPTSPRGNLDGLPFEVVTGDLRDAASLRPAVSGVSALFHVAADYRLWAPDPEEILRGNVEGTRNLLGAALEAGVGRVVYTSSVATLRVAGATAPVDENASSRPEDTIGVYKRSKTIAERVVEEMVTRDGLPAVIVNPSTPIGPRDIRPTPTGRVILDAALGKVPAFVDTGLNLAHVDDIAAGHLLAYERGVVGQRYILGGENVTLREMLTEIAAQTGRRPPRFALPRAPLFPVAWAMQAVARFTGREPLLTADALRMSRYRMFFTSARAERELDYTHRPWQDGVRDALDWYRGAGRIRP